ncbi:MAG: homocysteine biosynthesis protein [Bacillota bacterium]|nr:homocysteine biosynthesis protein [Bacillota bacterium]
MHRTFDEVNEKIKSGEAVVMTAEEFIALTKEKGVKAATVEVDVVTCATFGPMCSSGAFLNFGHSDPPMRMAEIWLNDVQAYGGLAAVDTYIGATQPSETQGMEYGGAHVIQDLIDGKKVRLRARSYGTACYPRREIDTYITLDDLNQAYLYNPRNAYQNYAAATNSTDTPIYTYMGILLPKMSNVTYSTSGELSPLLKDPDLRTIGVGTRIFLGGAIGYVAWEGTQCTLNRAEADDGVEWRAGATIAVVGNLREMNTRYIRAAVYEKYGISMFVGIGMAMPVLDEELAKQLAKGNDRLYTKVFDYGVPSRSRPDFGWFNYAQLRSGSIEINGNRIPTAPLSSLKIAREIAEKLRDMIIKGEFLLTEPVAKLPMEGKFKPLEIRGD